jgi:hypothetical protein
MAVVNGIPSSVNPNTRIKGFDIVMSNLNKEIRTIENRTMAGLIKAASYIRRDMDRTPPLIPVKTGNMRSSWQVTPLSGGFGPALVMGFNANYALWVHEMLDSDINWTRKNSGPKFFEYSIKRNKDKVLQIIRDNVHIK